MRCIRMTNNARFFPLSIRFFLGPKTLLEPPSDGLSNRTRSWRVVVKGGFPLFFISGVYSFPSQFFLPWCFREFFPYNQLLVRAPSLTFPTASCPLFVLYQVRSAMGGRPPFFFVFPPTAVEVLFPNVFSIPIASPSSSERKPSV